MNSTQDKSIQIHDQIQADDLLFSSPPSVLDSELPSQ